MKSIAFGQFYPAESFIHKMDPRAKIIMMILYIVCSMICKNIISFAILLVSALVIVLLSRIPLRTIFGSLRPILFVLLFTVVLNVFWTSGEGTPLFHWRFITVYAEGLYKAVFMMVRIVAMIVVTGVLLTYTTTPIALTDALEQLLGPLKKLRVPVHEFSMMMTIALRFIPTLMEETSKIMAAQKARGADFASGNLIKRAKALIPILIPLFVSAFRRADELAVAMECRCYRGGEGRTKLHKLRCRVSDVAAVLLIVALGEGIILLNIYGIGYTM